MKTKDTGVCIAMGRVSATTNEVCRSLAEQGISTLVVQKEATKSEMAETSVGKQNAHWSGKPGQDLFFNGWKLLF